MLIGTAGDKLNAKAWLEQKINNVQVRLGSNKSTETIILIYFIDFSEGETSETISFYAIQSNDFPLSATVPCRFRLQLRQFVDGRPWILSIRR